MVDAVQLYSDGQTARAQAILKTLSVAAPENDGVWYYLALTQTVSNDLDGAEESLRKAVSLDGNNYWYRRMLARLCLMHGKTEEGIALYEALAKDFPDNANSVYELLDIYLNRKEFEKALSALDDIEKQRGLSEEVVRTRYEVLSAMGRQEEAVEEIHNSMVLDFTGKMRLIRRDKGLSRPITKCVDYIYAHIYDRITIKDLSYHTGVSASYLSRQFTKELGLPISDYIREKKIELSQEMLKNTDDSLADIALRLSFSSQSHFIQTFKAVVGMTPKKYRSVNGYSSWT